MWQATMNTVYDSRYNMPSSPYTYHMSPASTVYFHYFEWMREFRSLIQLYKIILNNNQSIKIVQLHCTDPGPGPGPLRSNIALVRSRNIFWTGLSPHVAFTLLFLFISYKPHFTSATKKKVIDVTASIGWIITLLNGKCMYMTSVSYTHLTLPTIYSV